MYNLIIIDINYNYIKEIKLINKLRIQTTKFVKCLISFSIEELTLFIDIMRKKIMNDNQKAPHNFVIHTHDRHYP